MTARGNSGLHVYEDDFDRNRLLGFLAQEAYFLILGP